MMRDPDYWQKPEEFNPERFLRTDKDGNTSLIKEERLAAFGIGKLIFLQNIPEQFDVILLCNIHSIQDVTTFLSLFLQVNVFV